MNELQVKTLTLEPAKVEFNHEEIEKQLEESLKKYSGLVFTEDTATECRNTIAELRKGKRAVDQYRLKIKRELTAPVTEFENQCKALNKKFDEVINPLVEQHDAFEEQRKKEKEQKVWELIREVVEEFNLNEKHASQIAFNPSYLNKSASLKSIKDDLTAQAERLQLEQQKKEADTQVIQSTAQLANERYDVSLSEMAYVRLLDFKEVSEIKKQILDDAQNEAEKRLEVEKRVEQKNQKQQEIETIFADGEPIASAPVELIDDPFSDPFAKPQELTIAYKITGTNNQLSSLQYAMEQMGVKWEVLRNVNV